MGLKTILVADFFILNNLTDNLSNSILSRVFDRNKLNGGHLKTHKPDWLSF